MDIAAWEARIATVRSQGMAAVTDMAIGRFFSESFRAQHPETVDTVRTGLLNTSPDGYSGCGAAIRDMELLDRLRGLDVPTLVIGGKKDVSTPFEGHGDKIAAAVHGAQTALLDTAHLPCLEAPSAFAGAVRDFLAQALGGTAVRDAGEVLFQAGLKTRRLVRGLHPGRNRRQAAGPARSAARRSCSIAARAARSPRRGFLPAPRRAAVARLRARRQPGVRLPRPGDGLRGQGDQHAGPARARLSLHPQLRRRRTLRLHLGLARRQGAGRSRPPSTTSSGPTIPSGPMAAACTTSPATTA
jgi:hypothetical protein